MLSTRVQADEKLHTACDECRTRKLKCSREKPTCSRCKNEKIECVFSPRKQMGRPRKRRREGDAESDDNMAKSTDAHGAASIDLVPSAFQDSTAILPPHLDHPISLGSFADDHLKAHSDSHSHDHSNGLGFSPSTATHLNGYTPPIDPSLWGNTATTITSLAGADDQLTSATCTCLPVMYLTLSELQSIQSFSFPQVIIPLRKAMSVLSDLIHCPECPKDMFSAMQNISSIRSLCKAIVERSSKVLMCINAEAELLERNGERKPYRVGDMNPALQHLHTGTLDCPMGFNVELEAKEWKRMAKAALKSEIYGNGSNPRPLMLLVAEAEERQQRWHAHPEYYDENRKKMFGDNHENANRTCEALHADHLRRVIGSLQWE